jgi:hypothetical protein
MRTSDLPPSLAPLEALPGLHSLDLSGSKIAKLDQLKQLTDPLRSAVQSVAP